MDAKEYLELVKDWDDPYPRPVVAQYPVSYKGDHYVHPIYVVRDDRLGFGSKVRALDYLVGHDPENKNVKEWVFGSCPATGYAQVSLPVVCNYYDKKAVLFMAKRDPERYTQMQKLGITNGAVYHWVPDGMLNVTQRRAKDYVEASPKTRRLLPIGLEHPTVIGSFIKVARNLKIDPDFVWSVGSSGTLNRSLQLAFPNAEVHVVSVGHTMKEREIGRAKMHRSPYKFDKPVKKEDAPPYPSVSTYDAKVWRPLMTWLEEKHPKGKVLVWNVA